MSDTPEKTSPSYGEAAACRGARMGENACEIHKKPAKTRTGNRVLVEVICEREHCVIYDYAITTVEFVAEDYGGRVQVRPVVRRGSKKNVERYLELCRINGRHLSVPTILIDGKVAFTDVPEPADLRKALEETLAKR